MHALAPKTDENLPATQSMQTELTPSPYVPGWQSVQFEPLAETSWPEGHELHSVAPVSLNLPSGQVVQ